jgi:hypothetical protein
VRSQNDQGHDWLIDIEQAGILKKKDGIDYFDAEFSMSIDENGKALAYINGTVFAAATIPEYQGVYGFHAGLYCSPGISLSVENHELEVYEVL